MEYLYVQGTFGAEVISINKIDQILDLFESSWQETITNRQVFSQEEVKANKRNQVGKRTKNDRKSRHILDGTNGEMKTTCACGHHHIKIQNSCVWVEEL